MYNLPIVQLAVYFESARMDDLLNQFKIAREAKNETLESISQELKIPQHYLEAIENSDFHLLPGSVYAIGFIKNYAKFLNIDHADILSCFKESRILQKKIYIDTEKQPQIEKFNFYIPFLKNNTSINTLYIVYAVIIIMILALISLL